MTDFFGSEQQQAPATGAGSTTPETPELPVDPPVPELPASPVGGPTAPSEVPDSGREVEETTEPCNRFRGQIIEITSIANSLPMTRGGAAVSPPHWLIGPPSFIDGAGSTHPAVVATEGGSDVEMVIKVDVQEADGLSGTAELVGSLSDGSLVEWKGDLPLSVGVQTVTVRLDLASTRLARHRGDIVWEADVPGCGKHIIGRTRVEIYRIIRDTSYPFLANGRPVEALRFLYENASMARINAAAAWELSDRQVSDNIATFMHGGHGLTYDTVGGATAYIQLNASNDVLFEMTNYIAKANGATVNCHDQASALVAFSGIMGVRCKTRYIRPFGFINTTTLVGGIVTNNPFHVGNGTPAEIDPAHPNRTDFANHGMFMDDTRQMAFDACAGPHVGTEDYDAYMIASVDISRGRPAWRHWDNGLEVTEIS